MATAPQTFAADKTNEPPLPPSPSSKAKETVKAILKRAGLFDAVAPFYRRVKKFTGRYPDAPSKGRGIPPAVQLQSRMADLINRAVLQIKTTPVYSQTPDASYPLADQCRGDNLVVIAIKR